MDANIMQTLDEGANVITSTRRLAYELSEAYSRHQIAQGKTVWSTAKINTWDGQMQDYWHALSVHLPTNCLSPFQTQSLLADIIESDIKRHHHNNDPATAALWNLNASAKTALEAWQLCHQWKISYSRLRDSEHLDHASFGRWATALSAHLQKNNWITSVQIADYLVASDLSVKNDIVFFGFDHLSTQQQLFITNNQSDEISISEIKQTPKRLRSHPITEFDDTRTQWQHIGAWAREKLNINPQFKLGIITPNTEDIRFIANVCLREQLIPQFYQHVLPIPFHFSQGEALSQTPIVKHALACLDLLGLMRFKQLSQIFLSTYWGGVREQKQRIFLINRIRNNISYQFDLFELIKAISTCDVTPIHDRTVPSLDKKLSELQSIKSAHRRPNSIMVWRAVFEQCLTCLGWPGSNLDSTEFQAQQAWLNFLDDWVKLDAISPLMSLNQALSSLKQHCQQTQFQAQANIDAPVQIMGILETAELKFDAVWLAGFDDQAWPVANNANPFIPIHQQIAAGIPDASRDRHTEYTALKTRQLLALCEDTTISYVRNKDDVALNPSPLLNHRNRISSNQLNKPFELCDAIRRATPELVSKSDDIGVALDARNARGGTGVISLQSACPFSAYARYRLNSGMDDDPEMGLDRLQRGSLMHEVLANIWAELRNSNNLVKLINNNNLRNFIKDKVNYMLKLAAQYSGLGDGFLAAESDRLSLLIQQWLMEEAKRPAFQVVATELKCEYEINGLRLNFILDRVDQFTASAHDQALEASYLILDYKSKKCNLKDWASERPKEPQIPLYYLTLETKKQSASVLALSFAQVKQNECEFVGISQHDTGIEGIKTLNTLNSRAALKKEVKEWSYLKSKWKTRIDKLALDYRQGVAHVDPKSAESCTYCDFSSLCRISSRNRTYQADDTA